MAVSAVMAASGAAPAVAASTFAGLWAMEMSSETVMYSAQLPWCTVGLACSRKPKTSSPAA